MKEAIRKDPVALNIVTNEHRKQKRFKHSYFVWLPALLPALLFIAHGFSAIGAGEATSRVSSGSVSTRPPQTQYFSWTRDRSTPPCFLARTQMVLTCSKPKSCGRVPFFFLAKRSLCAGMSQMILLRSAGVSIFFDACIVSIGGATHWSTTFPRFSSICVGWTRRVQGWCSVLLRASACF